MPDSINRTRRAIVIAAPGIACMPFASDAVHAEEAEPPSAVEGLAIRLLEALNLTEGAEWAMKVGSDGDVLLFHQTH